MPLRPGKSKEVVSQNIREFHTGPTYAHTAAKFGKERANRQAIAVALNTARKYADGGDVDDDDAAWADVPRSPEGRPQITVNPLPQVQPPPENPMRPGALAPAGLAAIEAARNLGQEFNPLRYFEEPELKDMPSEPGKVPPAEADPTMGMVGAAMDIAGWLPMGGATKAATAAAPFAKAMAPFLTAAAKAAKFKPFHKIEPNEIAHLDLGYDGYWQHLAPSMGTMPGGMFRYKPTGEDYYIKAAPNVGQLRNEILTAKLYKLAGVPVADVRAGDMNGHPYLISKIIPGKTLAESGEDYQNIPGLHENFPIDAWLGNRDAVGTGPEHPLANIIIDKNGMAHRIDTGGGLLYRGTGGLKANFPDTVEELESMKDPEWSFLSGKVFGNLDQLSAMLGANKLADIDTKELAKLVTEWGPPGDDAKKKLLTTLLKRREDVLNKYGITPKSEPGPKGGGEGGGGQGFAPTKVEVKQPIKLMNLNKTHNADQIINAIKNYHWDEISSKKITEKQKSKIGTLLDKVTPSQLHEMLQGIEPQEAINVKSWLSDSTAAKLKSLNKVSVIPTIENITDSSPIKDVFEALSKQLASSGKVSYSQHMKGKDIANKFTNSEIYDAIKDFPVPEQQKALSWLPAEKKHAIETHSSAQWLKKYNMKQHGYIEDAIKELKPFDFREYQSPFPKKHSLEIPNISAAKAAEIQDLGFNPREIPLHGGTSNKGNYPQELGDPTHIKKWEQAYFASPKYHWALRYAGHNPSGVLQYFARAPRTLLVDWEHLSGDTHYSGTIMDKLIKAGHKHNVDLIIIKDMDDPMEGKAATQYAFLKTQNLRAPKAQFAPHNLHKAWPMAGLVGGALFMPKDDAKADERNRGGGVPGYAGGGYPMLGPAPWEASRGALVPRASGMIRSPIPGRTDKIPMNVAAGSYIIPADIPSALGQGNTMAGSSILSRMIKGGSRVSSRAGQAHGFHWMRPPYLNRRPRMAEGGQPEGQRPNVDIIAAGGEYVVTPDDVANIGHGDENAGHKVLDQFVMKVRHKNIETLKGLKPPKK